MTNRFVDPSAWGDPLHRAHPNAELYRDSELAAASERERLMLGDFPGPDLPNLRKAPRRDVVRVSLEGPEVHRWVLSDAWAQRGERIWWTVSHGDHPLRATVTFDIPVGEKHVVRFDDVLDQLTQVGPKGIFDVINADTTSIFLRREGIDVRGGR